MKHLIDIFVLMFTKYKTAETSFVTAVVKNNVREKKNYRKQTAPCNQMRFCTMTYLYCDQTYILTIIINSNHR